MDLREGLVLPGFVDTHVHFPQVRAIGGLGMPLLDWLEKCALPEEARLADATYAASVATDFVSGLARAGTTTALVFGSHFAGAVDALFTEATRVGLRVTSGLVLSDRILREDLFTTPERAYAEGLELAKRWHGQGRTRYAVTPRFSLSCTESMLESAGALLARGARPLVHLAPQRERRGDRGGAPAVRLRLHDVVRAGRAAGAAQRARPQRAPDPAGAHAARPGTAPRSRTARPRTPRSAAGCSRWARTWPSASGSRSAPTSAPAPASRCSRRGCRPTSPSSCSAARATGCPPRTCSGWPPRAGAEVLGLADTVGDFSVGKEFDALWLRPSAGSTLDVALRHAESADGGGRQGVRPGRARPTSPATWVAGEPVHRGVASSHVADPGRRPRRDPRRAPPRGGGRRQRRPAQAQAEAILEESDERTDEPEGTRDESTQTPDA